MPSVIVKPIFLRIGTFLAVAVAILLGLECGIRILHLVPEAVVPMEIGQFDPLLGWSYRPSSRGVSSATGQSVEYVINSFGYRGPERGYEKPKGTFRIVVLGDSRTFGFGVPIERHFTMLL